MAVADDLAVRAQPRTTLPGPYLLFLGEVTEIGYAKTALGLRDWARERCIGELRLAGATVSTELAAMDVVNAYAAGARALVIGVATRGGLVPASWLPTLLEALEAGLDIISGMHVKLADVPALAAAASRLDRRLIDLRTPPADIPVASGRRRTGRRLLTVGTDCALGKKYTALAIARGLRARGVDADFRASGQTGILIAGAGIPIDAVVSDFVTGAAELLSPDAAADHWDVIEGQGSLFHPSYAPVSLGLLHGSQPDAFVVCHQPGRTHVLGLPDFPLPSLTDVIDRTTALGQLTNPAIRCVGISLNTASLNASDSKAAINAASTATGLPAFDPLSGGADFEHFLDGFAT